MNLDELNDLLGKGSFGIVWKAVHLNICYKNFRLGRKTK
jgi:hypothetical protein